MNAQPIPETPALKLDDTLIIGDLHIGVEAHLGAKGIHLVSHTQDMLKMILSAGDGISRVVMIGDLKDSVPGSTKQEYREIPAFCDSLLEHFGEVALVRGNHDTTIEEFVPGAVRIYPATGAVINGAGLIHGHTWPSQEVMSQKLLIMGHEHPTVLFKDSVGAFMTEPCWIKGKFNKYEPKSRYERVPESFIIVPAFNPILGGSPVNAVDTPMLGPILNSNLVNLNDSDIYLLDGLCLGRRCDLMVADGRMKHRKSDGTASHHNIL